MKIQFLLAALSIIVVSRVAAVCLILAEVVLNAAIIVKVPYTEIDWVAYMQV